MILNLLLVFLGLVGSASCMRDPFIPITPKDTFVKKDAPHESFRVSGILKYRNNYSGILDDCKDSYVVFKGMQVKNCYINDVGNGYIMLSRNGKTKKLVLR